MQTTQKEAADVLALEGQVCFALAVANRSVLAVYRPLLEPLGLSHPQYLVMLALWERPEPLSVRRLAELLQLEPATVSPLLKRLEAAGLIARTRSATDERQLDLTLTDSGRQLRARALAIPAAVVTRLQVSVEELQTLHAVLSRFNAAAVAAV